MKTKIAEDALQIWKAGVAAVDAQSACQRSIQWDSPHLVIDDVEYELKPHSRIVLVGAGKAARGMMRGTLESIRQAGLADRVVGWLNVPGEGPTESLLSDRLFIQPSRPLGSNLPTLQAVEGTRKIVSYVQNCQADDLVICLISGGGSSLLVDPIDGLMLNEKIQLTAALSMAGANIHQLNIVRRALSKVKGGGLLRACKANQMATLVISDVLNDDLATIASGPTVIASDVDPAAALDIIHSKLDKGLVLTKSMERILCSNMDRQDRLVSSRLPGHHHVHVLANNATAVDAAGTKAVDLGYRYMMYCHRESEGDAQEVGTAMARNLLTIYQSKSIDCEIVGGEPTVSMQRLLDQGAKPGRGGRNQHAVACAASALIERFDELDGMEFCILSGGTDGEDGSSPSAGAWVDHLMLQKLAQQKSELARACQRFDTGTLFERLGTTIDCGLTGTNVCDLRVMLVKH